MTAVTAGKAIGQPRDRVEGPEKVSGTARYADEYQAENVAYGFAVRATAARGLIRAVDHADALAVPAVVAVLSCENAPRLQPADEPELALFQSREISYRGQIVAAVVADSLEAARQASRLVRVDIDARPHHVLLRDDDPGLYKPGKVNPGFPTDTEDGDPDAALAAAAVTVDATYRTPAVHNNPMEPHATLAQWDGGTLTLYDSTQGASVVSAAVARLFGLPPESVRVISPHVGGAFGSKGSTRPQVVLAALAARQTGRPVKVAVTRQQMFDFTGYRTPTIQRVRLGASRDGTLTAITHDVVEQTSQLTEFAEQTAVPTRVMYAAPNRRTSHRLARLDVPTPAWMRAPGECPGMFALESAMDELASACGIDPVELRLRNEPDADPESGAPFSSRNLVACLREGARRFGWPERRWPPGGRMEGRQLVGLGVAASTYPARRRPSQASARADATGFTVRLAAADIGTGARTILTQIAADALAVPPEQVRVEIGDSALPKAPVAGGSMGTASYGAAVVAACESLRLELSRRDGAVPPGGIEVSADTADERGGRGGKSSHAFGAQFVEVRVDADTGEVRVPRMLGIFAAGRIMNPKTARSQLIGGMTMGLSMALLEESVMDAEFGDYLNHDLAGYHIAACADVPDIEVGWVEEDDRSVSPMGAKGIGEIGIVGTAAAIASAVHHATGVRIRDLPIQVDKLIGAADGEGWHGGTRSREA